MVLLLEKKTPKFSSQRKFQSESAPQKFVPANLKQSPIRKMKVPQYFHATQ